MEMPARQTSLCEIPPRRGPIKPRQGALPHPGHDPARPGNEVAAVKPAAAHPVAAALSVGAQVHEEQVEARLRIAARVGEAGAPAVGEAMDKDDPSRGGRVARQRVAREAGAVVGGGLDALEGAQPAGALREPVPGSACLLGAVPLKDPRGVLREAGGHLAHAHVTAAAQVRPELLLAGAALRAQNRRQQTAHQGRRRKPARPAKHLALSAHAFLQPHPMTRV